MIPSYPNLLLQVESIPALNGGGALALGNFSPLELFVIAMICVVLIAGFGSLLNLSFSLMKLQKLRLLEKLQPELLEKVGLEVPELTESWWQRTFKKLTDRVPVEEENDILLDHNYDGVMELDNNLPPWWKGVFYITVAIAPIYLYVNHFSGVAVSSTEQYEREVVAAEAEVKAYLATQSDLVDETNVTLLVDAQELASGGVIFESKCVACHGKLGEGGIGPNLTDDFWIHGGDIKDVFKVVKYGVPEMGMIPWKNELRAGAIQQVASYIKSLRGTNPPNPKEPQGEPYVEAETPEADAEQDK
ncbi:cytochrome C oxidase subunit III [Lewinellaceae bacterium SD302]|nr:cytochrome C oxidase subunit III [Lewinellaceae bacterium SD302]